MKPSYGFVKANVIFNISVSSLWEMRYVLLPRPHLFYLRLVLEALAHLR